MSAEFPLYDEISKRWYRQFEGTREYEPDKIFVTKAVNVSEPKKAKRLCPFGKGHSKCRENCALWMIDHCRMSQDSKGVTQGRYCPITKQVCTEQCQLYCDGCTL